MSRIGSKNTAPELKVRKLLHSMGYRFRLHRRDLPGTPDIVLPSRQIAIFVHGCFWHAHGCRIGQPPKTNTDFWTAKLDRNVARDSEKKAALEAKGWTVYEVWQCETKDIETLSERFGKILSASEKNSIDNGANPL